VIDYHHTVVHVWDLLWTLIAVLWVYLWYRWYRSGFPLPDKVMNR
jgi:hypothetical protein